MTKVNEIWKDIKSYENRYQVSNAGNIRTLERSYIKINGAPGATKGKIKILRTDRRGYVSVALHTGIKTNNQYVHKLVASTFIPNPDNKPCINHIDGDKSNNNISNLEWCTHLENNVHSYNVLGRKIKTGKITTAEKVRGMRKMHYTDRKTIMEVALHVGRPWKDVWEIITGRRFKKVL